jgi:predicted DNA-binding antitoxin AbrB/MazE fold protein
MNVITINAIYQNGMIKPLDPVNLAENEQVILQIIRDQEKGPAERKVISLEGIWAGLGDPTFEEIETLTEKAHQERLNKLIASLDK